MLTMVCAGARLSGIKLAVLNWPCGPPERRRLLQFCNGDPNPVCPVAWYGATSASRQLPDQIHLVRLVRRSVLLENLVEPHRRLTVDVGLLPRVPRQIRLRLPGNETPVDCGNLVLLRDRQ